SGVAVLRHQYVVVLEAPAELALQPLVVFNHEQPSTFPAHAMLPEALAASTGSASGRRMVIQVPRPGCDATSIAPPESTTKVRAWYAPIPMPLLPFVVSKGL